MLLTLKKSLGLFLALAIVSTSCQVEDNVNIVATPTFVAIPNSANFNVTKQVSYQPTTIPSDTKTTLFYYDALDKAFDPTALKDTVVLFVAGGPRHVTDTSSTHIIDEYVQYSTGNNRWSTVGLKQAHNLNLTIFGSGTTFTDANAEEVRIANLTLMENAVKYLKSLKKAVVLYGHSNGSFLVDSYLADGRTLADYHIMSGNRLIRDTKIVTAYTSGLDYDYGQDGITFKTSAVPTEQKAYFNVLTKIQLSELKDYTSLLAGKSFYKKIAYSLSEYDGAVGRVTEPEIAFFRNNKDIIALNIPKASHGQAVAGLPNIIAIFRALK
ncbi:hypothetical protein EXU85_06960 [Spirosoma sp. KCTC 42546]|uniref:hypothetical protein n=1 Tax=Spirosoma sp. KCTC 42546 TaxID=2520506 RepID=UPI001158AF88|nr:hypothetical protein [Spirosoma sp. KCTC 42546]QDK78354.1 hypothetical protein EXU85_06960 [Spirosoma sp. KCTC 42546]